MRTSRKASFNRRNDWLRLRSHWVPMTNPGLTTTRNHRKTYGFSIEINKRLRRTFVDAKVKLTDTVKISITFAARSIMTRPVCSPVRGPISQDITNFQRSNAFRNSTKRKYMRLPGEPRHVLHKFVYLTARSISEAGPRRPLLHDSTQNQERNVSI